VATAALGAWLAQQPDASAPANAESRQWLVAPFELQTGNTALDWLREGAVNMLGLSLSHWDDLSVVDYERTFDLLRTVQDARTETRRLALEEARQLARRAGAGSLIMGQITTANDSLFVVARRYDVASGARIDEATAGAPLDGDPRIVFDAIARELLDLAGGPALTVALRQQTTASVESYRHYLSGLRALNRWELPRADSLFAIATELDSTFALAYYKRSVGLGWRNIADSTYAESAERAVLYGDRLPTRLREVVAGNRDLARGFTALRRDDREAARAAWASAQQRLATLLATDSTNVDAWYILADADFHAALGTGMRSSDSIALLLTRSMRGFERAVALDSSFHLAYEHLVNLHRFGAQEQSGIVIVDGAVRPQRTFTDTSPLPELRRLAQERTKQLAAHWVALEPDGAQAWSALLDTYGVLRQHDSALVHLAQASRRPAVYSPGMAFMQASYRLRAQRPDGVHDALRDAMRRFPPDTLRARRGAGAVQLPLVGAAVAASTGAFALADSLLRHAATTTPTLTSVQMPTRELTPFLSAGLRLAAGVRPTPALLSAVRSGVTRLEREGVTPGTRATYAGVPYAAYLASRDSTFAVIARRWLADDGVRARELDAMLALDRGDTMRARAIADSFATPDRLARATLSYAGLRVLTQADVRARLGDARGALAAYAAIAPANFQFTIAEPGAPAWTRSHLERARLYEQLGVRDSARLAYDTFAAWWNDADPSLQGAVRAARSASQRLQDAPGTRAIPTARR
jgi:TolB-like protein